MGVFQTTQTFPMSVPDLSAVARHLMAHFEAQAFEVTGEATAVGGWCVSITKGELFATVVGNKASLNVDLEPTSLGTVVRAEVGIFGQQVVPSLVTYLVAWPMILPQIWGMVRQSKLDEEALAAVKRALTAAVSGQPLVARPPTATGDGAFCTACGTRLASASARFCGECGTAQTPEP